MDWLRVFLNVSLACLVSFLIVKDSSVMTGSQELNLLLLVVVDRRFVG